MIKNWLNCYHLVVIVVVIEVEIVICAVVVMVVIVGVDKKIVVGLEIIIDKVIVCNSNNCSFFEL